MVFPSVPVYLDPPNWPQQQVNQQLGVAGENPQLPPLLQPPGHGGGGGGGGSRPGSISDRTRLAKIPQLEAALKCPRCESTNTKFCYFNNYSLSQPRHFCKTCRRYWTRGGALRNVPVGGGCRRNRRSKASNKSKSPIKASSMVNSSCTNDIIGQMPPQLPQLPILPPLHHIGDYNSTDIGLSFGGIPAATGGGGGGVEFQIGSTSSGCGSNLSSRIVEQWRLQEHMQQFPFLTSLGTSITGLFPAEREGVEPPNYADQLGSKPLETGVSQAASVKMEENQELNLSHNFLGVSGHDQYWGGNHAWTDLSGFASSSTSHLI